MERPTYRWTKIEARTLEDARGIVLSLGWMLGQLDDDAPDGAVCALKTASGSRRAWIVPRGAGELMLATEGR